MVRDLMERDRAQEPTTRAPETRAPDRNAEPRGLIARLRARHAEVVRSAETGLATAEYAIATVAAAGFAGLLITLLRSNAVRELLLSIVTSALSL